MSALSIEPNPRITFGLRHEDAHLIVVEKPTRLVSQPGKAHQKDSLLNGLFARYGSELQNLGRSRDFGMLHRLDRDASGLLIVARTSVAYDALREMFGNRSIAKYYWAVTCRAPAQSRGVIRRPIIEVQGAMKTAKIGASGKPALTAFRLLDESVAAALIECRAVTGRLHQVRVHLASIGCAILGDDLYGGQAVRRAAARVALHAHRLTLDHPITGNRLDVRSPFPRDLRALLRRTGLSRPGDGPHQLGSDSVGEKEPGVGEDPSPV